MVTMADHIKCLCYLLIYQFTFIFFTLFIKLGFNNFFSSQNSSNSLYYKIKGSDSTFTQGSSTVKKLAGEKLALS